ncbi:MAG: iron-sulfur cluster assembly protein [Actinomycetota bacterium]
MIDEGHVVEALSTVRDPELDEPITELGFVERAEIDGATVSVKLVLPTFFCAPNFAYIMATDAKAALAGVEGVKGVKVVLVDHFASSEINDGLANDRDFEETFPGDANGEGLSDLRDLFTRKAFISRQERLCRSMLAAGGDADTLTRLVVRDLPETPETRAYLARRAELGIDTSDAAPFLVTPAGEPILDGAYKEHMRFARTVSVSIEGNSSFCRGLLETRYGRTRPQEART